jgi:hypothetical protein
MIFKHMSSNWLLRAEYSKDVAPVPLRILSAIPSCFSECMLEREREREGEREKVDRAKNVYYYETANSEDPAHFNSSAPKLIFRQAGDWKFGRPSCLQDNSSARTTQKTSVFHCCSLTVVAA